MTDLSDLPPGWERWTAEDAGRVVLTFRPDVFDGTAFPPGCLPTVTVAPGGRPNARPERRTRATQWYVALYLEPDVRLRDVDESFRSREAAIERAVAVTDAFVAGHYDVRGAYRDPPAAYLDRLDDLVGVDE